MTLHAVVIAVPEGATLSRRDRVGAERRVARVALNESAHMAGLPAGAWRQDEAGVPLFENDVYWSISHKAAWAAAVAADRPVGIDIESLAPRRTEFLDQVATSDEWDLAGRRDWETFFRFWTAKEATLKANRVGIGCMDSCKVAALPNEGRALLEYDGSVWGVEYFRHADHLAAVAVIGGQVKWHVVAEASGR